MPHNGSRILNFAAAVNEAIDQMMAADPRVYIIGEGVPDPKGLFGTSVGLAQKHGRERVFDMPVAENGMTGIAIGTALMGMRPVMVHARVDFTLYAMDQIVNNAAKWYSMFGGQLNCPLVIRVIMGQGWGQGNQHSQNLQNMFAHVPGLKVLMPSTAYDAKGMLVSAIKDNNPVIFFEHRWLHGTTSVVPETLYEVPLGQGKNLMEGSDLTLVTWGYPVLESVKACELLKEQGVHVEVVEMPTLSPMDYGSIKKSVLKTKRLLVVDGSWRNGGLAAEVVTRMCEDPEVSLLAPPKRITFPDFPTPSTPGLSQYYYPRVPQIFRGVAQVLGKTLDPKGADEYEKSRTHDVPDKNFTGPF